MKLPQHILDLNPEIDPKNTRVSVSLNPYKSILEERAAKQWAPLIFKWWMYEPFALKFPGGSYTPDMFGELKQPDRLAIVEIKGYNKNLRADKLKFKAAYEVHRVWLDFCWLIWSDKNGWEEKWNDR